MFNFLKKKKRHWINTTSPTPFKCITFHGFGMASCGNQWSGASIDDGPFRSARGSLWPQRAVPAPVEQNIISALRNYFHLAGPWPSGSRQDFFSFFIWIEIIMSFLLHPVPPSICIWHSVLSKGRQGVLFFIAGMERIRNCSLSRWGQHKVSTINQSIVCMRKKNS